MFKSVNDPENEWQLYDGQYRLRAEVKILRQVDDANSIISRMNKKLERATAPMKRHRYVQRIHKAQARLLALKLAQP